MSRSAIKNVVDLTIMVGVGAILGGSFNSAVGDDPVELVYQWMRGIVFGGLLAGIVFFVVRRSSRRFNVRSEAD